MDIFSKDSVKVWNLDVLKHQLALNDSLQLFDDWNNNEQFDYVIDCTDSYSLPISSSALLCHNAYLINLSSGSIEFPFDEQLFNVHYLILNFDYPLLKWMNLKVKIIIHQNILFRIDNRR